MTLTPDMCIKYNRLVENNVAPVREAAARALAGK
jgi:hypothetical protein